MFSNYSQNLEYQQKSSRMMEINRFPAEMLKEVHRRLTPSSLKQAVLVDKRWRDVGQDPDLWEWCKVAVYSKEDIDNLSIKRLKNIKELLVSPDNWDAHDWEAFLRALEELSRLKKIEGLDWVSGGLNIADSGLLARSLAKLEDVTVLGLDYDHILELFSQMSSATRVKKFDLTADDLSQMEAELFASALSRLEYLKLDVDRVTKDQVQAFLTEVMNNRSLKRLVLPCDFCQKMWRHLKPGFIASVLSTVEDVSLGDYEDISSDHMEALFTELSDGAQLKRLQLNYNNLSEIGAAFLSNALSRLEELRLNQTSISIGQIEALFEQISLRTQMKTIALVQIDLSQLDRGLFSKVMARLEDLHLLKCDITIDQVQELFKEMSSNSHLKSLYIGRTDLSSVHPDVLAKALSRLETVILELTSVTTEQGVALISEMARTSVMKKFGIKIDWDLSSVNPNVLASALVRLEEVSLSGTSITHDQAMALCREISQNNQLKKLVLDDIDFSSVDPEVLATAVTNVKEINFRSCISPEQVTSVFQQVLDGEKKLRKLELRVNAGDVDPEMVRKVEEKLKGQLDMTVLEEDSDSDKMGEGSSDNNEDDDHDDEDDQSGSGIGIAVSEEEMEDVDEDAADNEEAVKGNDEAPEEKLNGQ